MRELPSVGNNAAADRGAVVVTGTSSGIGRACALALDALGFRVYAGVRTEEDGQSLQARASRQLRPLLLDITREDDLSRAAVHVEYETGSRGLAGLVNNAGICITAPMELVPLSNLRRQFDVNVVGQVAATQAFLPLLRRGKGRIVNIGSTSGRIASRLVGPYCASKFALEAVTTALRLELLQSGVQVSLIEPGVIATPFWDKAIKGEEELAKQSRSECLKHYTQELATRHQQLKALKQRGRSPDVVCRAIVHALMAPRPKLRYVVGLDAKLRTVAGRILPEGVRYWLASRRK